MSAVVTSMLCSTVGLLLSNKVRDDVTADTEKFRRFIVRELDDIKSAKLNGLSRKDLLSSCCFLQEGINLLFVSLNISELDQEAVTEPTADDRGETSSMSSVVEFRTLNEDIEVIELHHAIGKMKIYSDNEFEYAKKRFEDARKRATDAFCNEALNINDRIFAAKLRVVSMILGHLEDLKFADDCVLQYIHELYDLPAIQEMFSGYLSRARLVFGNEERVEGVKSVMLISYVLYRFHLKFSSCKLTDRLIWPLTIELGNRSFKPILDWREVATRKSMGDELSQLRDPYKLMLDEKVIPVLSAMNNRKLVAVEEKGNEIGNNE
jgi:hypothetical protein